MFWNILQNTTYPRHIKNQISKDITTYIFLKQILVLETSQKEIFWSFYVYQREKLSELFVIIFPGFKTVRTWGGNAAFGGSREGLLLVMKGTHFGYMTYITSFWMVGLNLVILIWVCLLYPLLLLIIFYFWLTKKYN